MTLESVLGCGAYCPQGHGLLFPLVLCSLSKKGRIFLRFAWVGWGWGSAETLSEPAQLLRTDSGGCMSLPQTRNSLKAGRCSVHLYGPGILCWTQHTVGMQEMVAKSQAKPGSSAPRRSLTAVDLPKHPAPNPRAVVYRTEGTHVRVISGCGPSVCLLSHGQS